MSDSYSVRVFKGGGEYGPAASVYWNDKFDQFCDLFYYLVILQSPSRAIVINTGLPPDFSVFDTFVKAWHPSCRIYREPDETPEAILKRAGVNPADVGLVVLTPLTIYTTGNVALFPNAKFAMARKGWIDFWAPAAHAPRLPKNIAMPAASRRYLADEAFDRWMLLDDEDEIAPGIECFWTGGHHASSMAIVVSTGKGKVILADCCFTYDNLEKNIPIGWFENLHEIYAAYDRIRRAADIVVPLYDPEVLQRFPGGVVALENALQKERT
jgi:glyoxylase-like metal-dependent hydrolase (beta-lactamase superfamily II)